MADQIPSSIVTAIAENKLAVLNEWLAKDPSNLQARSDNGETLLHKASYYGQVDVIRLLIDKGLSIDVTDSGGYSVLHEAARGGQAGAMRVLLELGADPDAKKSNGGTVDEAAKEKPATAEMLELLFRARNKPRWIKTADDEIAHVNYRPDLGYRLTEIFNFKSRTYVMIARNQQTGAESAVHKTFSDFSDTQPIAQAQQEFTRLGGALPDGYDHLDKPKKAFLSSRNFS